jgi:hypothetical protein
MDYMPDSGRTQDEFREKTCGIVLPCPGCLPIPLRINPGVEQVSDSFFMTSFGDLIIL